jgi:hypothetical protein
MYADMSKGNIVHGISSITDRVNMVAAFNFKYELVDCLLPTNALDINFI